MDDDTFISKKPHKYIFAEKDKAADLTEKTNRMLINSRAIVQETEEIGQSTLENLSVQREALERVENDLDNINVMTRATQKHLNNMKSFFGGIKSLFSSGGNTSAAGAAQPVVPTTRAMPKSKTLADVPSNIPAGSSSIQATSSSTARGSLAASDIAPSSASSQPEGDEFEANLSEIGFGLGRLKEMAMKLGDEIGDQNVMLERIGEKSERAGDSVKHQNRQMQQILKK